MRVFPRLLTVALNSRQKVRLVKGWGVSALLIDVVTLLPHLRVVLYLENSGMKKTWQTRVRHRCWMWLWLGAGLVLLTLSFSFLHRLCVCTKRAWMVLVLCNACFFRLDMSKIRVVNELMGGSLREFVSLGPVFTQPPITRKDVLPKVTKRRLGLFLFRRCMEQTPFSY